MSPYYGTIVIKKAIGAFWDQAPIELVPHRCRSGEAPVPLQQGWMTAGTLLTSNQGLSLIVHDLASLGH
jgi:hypothetical protein